MADLTENDVGSYLTKNPEFARRWFLDHVGPDALADWLKDEHVPTPSHAIGSFSYGSRSSPTSTTFHDFVNGRRKKGREIKRRTKAELLSMDHVDLFMELIKDVANELDVNVLCYKILLNVKILTHGDRGSLFLARGSGKTRYLVSKLFDVSEDSSLDESLHTEDTQIRVAFGKGIAGTVALSKTPINIKDAYQDPRFNKEVDLQTGFRTKNLLCMPILNYEGDVVGVAQIINKTNGEAEFTARDQEVFETYLTFCGIGLTNAQLFEMSVQEYKRNQMLLNFARGIFTEQSNLESLLGQIMLQAQSLLKCQRCTVYLIDNSLIEDDSLHDTATSPVLTSPRRTVVIEQLRPEEICFFRAFELNEDKPNIVNPSPANILKSAAAQLAREVGSTGQVKNVSDTASDPSHMQVIVDYDGFRIRSLLCLPIKNSDDATIGVVQFMNKNNGKSFTEMDANIVEAFAIFCGLGIHNCQMYESAVKLMAKQSVALEVLSYHATAPQEDVDRFKNAVVPTANDYRLYCYDFNDFPLDEDGTVKATIRMFLDMDIVNRFHVPFEVLCRWTLSVKKNYRPVIYHNWRHAFNVAQTMFTMLHTGKMARYMDHIEMFALVVACLCHDLDHRGTNNAFQFKVDSPLATLYSTSTLEHHHFDQCIMILNSEGNNIFSSMSADEYKRTVTILESAILSTDLALYFKKRGGFENLVTGGETKWDEPNKKDLLRGMMMTACDVAAITKPWDIQKEVAQLVASEFFEQGDIERNTLNQEPIAMMDRQKKEELPKMQVGFIDAICLPIYKLLSDQFVGLKPLMDGCVHNRTEWNKLRDREMSDDDEMEDVETSGGEVGTSS